MNCPPIIFPEKELRAEAGRPPLAAMALACARVQNVYEEAVRKNPSNLMRIRMAERGIPPAMALANRLLSQIDPEEGLGQQMLAHDLVPGLPNAKLLKTFGRADPSVEDPQAAWERWAAGLLGLNGHTINDAAQAAMMLPVVFIGCRPSWKRGAAAALWKLCWASSPFDPPRRWAASKSDDTSRKLRVPRSSARRVAYA